MNAFAQTLQQQTTRLLKLSHEMQACLLEEQAALSGLDRERILHITEQKNQLVRMLESQSRQLLELVSAQNIGHTFTDLTNWLEHLPASSVRDGLIKDWRTIHELTQASRKTNDSNGACVMLSQRQAARAIEVLRGQFSSSAQTYGPDGAPRRPGFSSRHSIV